MLIIIYLTKLKFGYSLRGGKALKQFVKTIGIAIILPLIYIIIQFILTSIYTFIYVVNNKSSLTLLDSTYLESINKYIDSNLYIIYFLTGVIVVALLFFLMKKTIICYCKFKKISFKSVIYIIIFTVGIAIFMNLFAKLLVLIFPNYKEISNMFLGGRASLLQLLIIIVLTPILEEMLFRGFILGYLRKNHNIIFSVIVQSLIFALVQGNILRNIYVFISGIILGFLYYFTNSLYGCIIFHSLFNFLVILIIPKILNIYPKSLLLLITLSTICVTFPITKLIYKYKKVTIEI